MKKLLIYLFLLFPILINAQSTIYGIKTDGKSKAVKVATDGSVDVSAYGTNGDGDLIAIPLDNSTNAQIMIDYPHHELHSGSAFTISYKADVANAGTIDLLIVTPDTTKESHFTYDLDVEAETDIMFYEGVTATTGSILVAYNRDRNSLDTALTVVSSTPTGITTGSTLIRSSHLGSKSATGGDERGTHEFILKKNTKYLFRLTNATALANYMSVKFDWYEHTPKN